MLPCCRVLTQVAAAPRHAAAHLDPSRGALIVHSPEEWVAGPATRAAKLDASATGGTCGCMHSCAALDVPALGWHALDGSQVSGGG